MEETSPSQPKAGWEKAEAPKKRRSAEEPIEMTMVEHLNNSWIPVYSRRSVEFIHAFATDPSKFQDEEQKEEFLHSISSLCRDAVLHDFCEDLIEFCSRYNLVEMIQTLLNLEPRDETCNRLPRLAMLAFAGLSTIGAALDTKKILRLCFNSVFFLRPCSAMSDEEEALCTRALLSMDTMLEVMVLNAPRSKSCEMLQNILEVLLDYLFSDVAAVQERVMDRIKLVSHLLAVIASKEDDEDEDDDAPRGQDDEDEGDDAPRGQDDEDEGDDAPRGQIEIPALGKLVGHLFFKLFKPQESISTVVEILCTLMTILSEQKCDTAESRVQPPEHWESEITSWVNASSACKVQAFGSYLGPDERTGVVLEAIEILGRCNLMNKDGPGEFLEEAMNCPEMWLTDVPKVVRHIFQYCNKKNTATADSFHSLLVFLVNNWPDKVITTALEAPPDFSDKVGLWTAMFSARQTLEKVLKELQVQVHIWHGNIFTAEQKSCLAFLYVLANDNMLAEGISPLYKNLSLLSSPKMEMVPLVLRALETLSESAKTAKTMKSLLPEMLKFLGHWSWEISAMALGTIHNILGQLKKKEASSMALKAVHRLSSLFDAEEECLRERSISLFRELLGKTTWRDKKAMRRKSWKPLVQLVLHMSDQAPSVAKASKEAVVAVAELLKWKELKELAQKEQLWKMGECLLAKESSRAEQFVLDSQRYLLSPQAPLREAALRFYGLAARHLTERNKDTVAAVLFKLGTMEAQDEDPYIRALAAQTSLILSALSDQQKSTLRWLCCWCH